jgi:cysteinyl-tRNA synthetase
MQETKMTISTDNISYLYEAIINMIKEDFRYIYVNCVYEKGWNYSHAKILYNELKKIGDYLLKNNLYDKYYIRFFDEGNYHP